MINPEYRIQTITPEPHNRLQLNMLSEELLTWFHKLYSDSYPTASFSVIGYSVIVLSCRTQCIEYFYVVFSNSMFSTQSTQCE